MKKGIIIGGSVLLFIVLVFVSLIIIYNNNLASVGGDNSVVFTIESGSSTAKILDDLKEKGLIKDTFSTKIFMKLNNKENIMAGKYNLNSNMNVKEILDILNSGKIIDESIKLTLIDGKRITDYVKTISETFNYTEKEIYDVLKDENYLKELINKYWFITDDILNKKLYYNLEGYIYPDTYAIDKNASIKDIINKTIDNMANKINNYKEAIESNKYSYHELLTLASIVELEASTEEDRLNVSGVFYNRLDNGWTLGSDVTTYYGAKKTFQDNIGPYLNSCNDYNTRGTCLKGLPIGPICNPSIISIKAAIEPTKNEYFYFVADIYKKVYFSKTAAEQAKVISDLISKGIWLET